MYETKGYYNKQYQDYDLCLRVADDSRTEEHCASTVFSWNSFSIN